MLAVDADAMAGASFARNFTALQPDSPPEVLAGPEHDLGASGVGTLPVTRPPDILIAGPPCQAFSRLGRGKLDSLSEEGFVSDPRNQLYRVFLDAVACWQPQAVVMENVPGMLSVAGTNYAQPITEELADLGYRTGYALLNAVWYGVPQFRERLFFLGIRSDLRRRPAAPPTTHHATLPDGYRRPLRLKAGTLPFGGLWELLEGELVIPAAPHLLPAVTVSQALDDLPPLQDHLSGAPHPRGDFRRTVPYRCEPHSAYANLLRTWPAFPIPSAVHDHVTRRTPRDYETFRLMKHGDRYPQALRIARGRFRKALRQLRAAGRAPARNSEAWKDLRKRYVPPYKEQDFPEKWGKLSPGGPSWTIPAHLAKDSYSHIHHDSDQARMISVREAARLQSFPDAFEFCGNLGDCFRQIGNAVPPLLAWAIASTLLGQLGFRTVCPPTLLRREGERS
jgi:DNA (cytosine-5)-methyltransferase 1